MAEIKFNDLYGQLKPMEQLFYDQQFEKKYDPNKDKSEQPIGLTGQSNYEAMKAAYDAKQEIPQKGILAGMIDAVSPFSKASASEVTPGTYNSNYDIASNMYTPEQQELLFGNPNYFNNQKFYKGTSVPIATPFSDSVNEPMNIEDFLGTSTPQDLGFIGNAPDIFDINQVGDPALNPGSVNVFGLDPFGVNENSIERGAVPEEGAITDRGRSSAFANPEEMGAYEMIGGTPVAIGDVLGMQQALEKSNLMDEPVNKQTFGIENLLGPMFTLAGFPTIGKSISAYNIGKSLQNSALGKRASPISKGIASLGSRFAGKMRGINPVTGRPNTQAQYEQNRADAKLENRQSYMIDRKNKGKSYSKKNLDKVTKELNERNTQKEKNRKEKAQNPNLRSGADNGGGRSKIVCTMMNERYGFGSFRNKIWMKFHESHGPEYQKGYHAIFLPLVKIAKGEGKINTAVRKVLEHMGRHVTADMFKIMKGKKRDTLGRIYRAIFEPACHIIGKIKSALGRG